MVLTLYKLDASPPVRSVFMVIEQLGIQNFEYVDVNLLVGGHLKEEYLKMNPQHTVPMLRDDDFCVWDSHAIAIYLITKYGKDDSLYPSDPKRRAVIDQRLHFDSRILFPAFRGAAGPVLFKGEKKLKSENLDKVKDAYELIEMLLSSEWLAGDQVTVADICCISTISTMNVLLPVEGHLFPNLKGWMKRCSEQEFYKKGNKPGLNLFQEVLQCKMA